MSIFSGTQVFVLRYKACPVLRYKAYPSTAQMLLHPYVKQSKLHSLLPRHILILTQSIVNPSKPYNSLKPGPNQQARPKQYPGPVHDKLAVTFRALKAVLDRSSTDCTGDALGQLPDKCGVGMHQKQHEDLQHRKCRLSKRWLGRLFAEPIHVGPECKVRSVAMHSGLKRVGGQKQISE